MYGAVVRRSCLGSTRRIGLRVLNRLRKRARNLRRIWGWIDMLLEGRWGVNSKDVEWGKRRTGGTNDVLRERQRPFLKTDEEKTNKTNRLQKTPFEHIKTSSVFIIVHPPLPPNPPPPS